MGIKSASEGLLKERRDASAFAPKSAIDAFFAGECPDGAA
jgi:hypothetical protein